MPANTINNTEQPSACNVYSPFTALPIADIRDNQKRWASSNLTPLTLSLTNNCHLRSLAGLYAVGDVEMHKFRGQVHGHGQPVDDLHGVQAHLHADKGRQVFIPLGQLNEPQQHLQLNTPPCQIKCIYTESSKAGVGFSRHQRDHWQD